MGRSRSSIWMMPLGRSQCLGQSGNTQSIRPHARTAITGTDIRGYANQ